MNFIFCCFWSCTIVITWLVAWRCVFVMEAVCSNLDHLGSLLKDFVRGQAHIEASLLFFFFCQSVQLCSSALSNIMLLCLLFQNLLLQYSGRVISISFNFQTQGEKKKEIWNFRITSFWNSVLLYSELLKHFSFYK